MRKLLLIILFIIIVSFSLIVLITYFSTEKIHEEQVINGDNKSNEKSMIKLIYPDAGFRYWLIVEKELTADPVVVVNELIKNPNTRIPKKTRLLNMEIKSNVAYVNLSKDFTKLSLGDNVISANIRTIVNTLCLNNALDIDAVQFLIEGKIEMAIGSSIGNKPYSPSNVKLIDL